MHFLSEYGLFLAKTATIVLAIILIFVVLFALKSKGKEAKDRLKIKNLNKKYENYKEVLSEEVLPKSEYKRELKSRKKLQKTKNKPERKRIFVLNFNGDIKASATDSLREEITAILTIAKPEDEVVVRLETGGGMVPHYGLAASQLKRLRDKNIHLTVTVDKIAASGGYMMACVANQIYAAPYAIIGSIGVVAQIPNFHKLLKKNDIDFEQITAGAYKRTLSLFGENTETGRKKMQEDVNNVHEIFKTFVKQSRPQVNIDEVATGEHWHGVQALDLKLVDKLTTSDDYLMSSSMDKDIYEVTFLQKKSLMDKLAFFAKDVYDNVGSYPNEKYQKILL